MSRSGTPGTIDKRGFERDAVSADYLAALPGTVEEVAERVGVSVGRAQKSLEVLVGSLNLVSKNGTQFERKEPQ